METLKCGACGIEYTDEANRNMIAGSGMCVDCNLRWLDDVDQSRWDTDRG